MDNNEQPPLTYLMQVMNDLRSGDHKHIDFGENLFHVRSDSMTPPTLESFPERDDSWSIIWYIASFSGLIAFFLIVSCSEWCCRLHVRGPAPQATSNATLRPSSSSLSSQATISNVQEAPPPAYDLFAPPSYDSVHKASGMNASAGEKSEYDVYVVPVHAIRMLQSEAGEECLRGRGQPTEDEPPSYISVQMNAAAQAQAPLAATSLPDVRNI